MGCQKFSDLRGIAGKNEGFSNIQLEKPAAPFLPVCLQLSFVCEEKVAIENLLHKKEKARR